MQPTPLCRRLISIRKASNFGWPPKTSEWPWGYKRLVCQVANVTQRNYVYSVSPNKHFQILLPRSTEGWNGGSWWKILLLKFYVFSRPASFLWFPAKLSTKRRETEGFLSAMFSMNISLFFCNCRWMMFCYLETRIISVFLCFHMIIQVVLIYFTAYWSYCTV